MPRKMDKDGIKMLLKQYSTIMDDIKEANKNLSGIANLKAEHPDTVKAAIITDMPHANTNLISDPVFQLISRYSQEEDKYIIQINELMDRKELIEKMLCTLDPFERRIVDLRHINNPAFRCDIWEWISRKVNYSRRQVIDIHNHAIDKLVIWYNT